MQVVSDKCHWNTLFFEVFEFSPIPLPARTKAWVCGRSLAEIQNSIPAKGMYVVGFKSFRPDIQKPRQMENAVRDI